MYGASLQLFGSERAHADLLVAERAAGISRIDLSKIRGPLLRHVARNRYFEKGFKPQEV